MQYSRTASGWRENHFFLTLFAPLSGHVFTFVAGMSVAGVHLHQHVFTRPAGTARDVPWHNADSP
ncbi:hypothetical protein [Nocardia beijingensis]